MRDNRYATQMFEGDRPIGVIGIIALLIAAGKVRVIFDFVLYA
ncbi:MAG: hypothetical protein ABFS22_13260 [Pseudomonadota bacterium]